MSVKDLSRYEVFEAGKLCRVVVEKVQLAGRLLLWNWKRNEAVARLSEHLNGNRVWEDYTAQRLS